MIAPRQGFAGETITFKSAFFGFQNVRVTPEPVQKPHPPIWLGGFTQAALRRAVRFGNGFTVPLRTEMIGLPPVGRTASPCFSPIGSAGPLPGGLRD